MIGYLKGKVAFKGENFVILDVNSVGYRLLVSEKTQKETVEGAELEFFVWPHLRRETIELYGCRSRQEFFLFKTLEKMPGIGPKTALILASAGSLEKLKKAIEEKDKEFLGRVRGVGNKKMQRVLLELTGQLKKIEKEKTLEKDEALGALLGLGFPKRTAQEALSQVSREIKESSERTKAALKILAK